jgi:hypothetical protein
LQVIQLHHFGRVLQQIEHVVHGVDQAVDLLAVQRRDEGAVQEAVHFCGDTIGRVFGVAHCSGMALARHRVGVVLHQLQKGAGTFGNVLPVLVKQLEEIALLG